MAFSLTWLPTVLLEAGLKVALVPNWEHRGHGDVGPTLGVLCHHTVGPRTGNLPSLGTLLQGTSKIPGPLAQLGLGRDGTWYVIAAGRANHAGAGSWLGVTTGNRSFIGVEAENTGLADDAPWPAVQLEAYAHGVAAILRHLGRDSRHCAGHGEYALPAGRKVDPSFDMAAFRSRVSTILAGGTPPPAPIPLAESVSATGSLAGRRTLRRGAEGLDVVELQRALSLAADGRFGPLTEAAVREHQRQHDLVPDGIVGPKTWAALGQVAVGVAP